MQAYLTNYPFLFLPTLPYVTQIFLDCQAGTSTAFIILTCRETNDATIDNKEDRVVNRAEIEKCFSPDRRV